MKEREMEGGRKKEGRRDRRKEGRGEERKEGKKKMPSLEFQGLIHLPQPNHRLEQAKRYFHPLGSIKGLKYINYIQQNNYPFNYNVSKPVCSTRLCTS